MNDSFSFASLIPLFLGVVFFGIGLVALIVAMRSKQKAKASQSWPTAAGTVLSAEVQEHRDMDSDHHLRVTYEPVVQYQYTAAGQQWFGNKIAFGATSSDRSAAQKKVNQYAPGTQVTVHYDPQKPGEGVLETAASGASLFMVIGIVFMVIGLIACCITAGLVIAGLAK